MTFSQLRSLPPHPSRPPLLVTRGRLYSWRKRFMSWATSALVFVGGPGRLNELVCDVVFACFDSQYSEHFSEAADALMTFNEAELAPRTIKVWEITVWLVDLDLYAFASFCSW